MASKVTQFPSAGVDIYGSQSSGTIGEANTLEGKSFGVTLKFGYNVGNKQVSVRIGPEFTYQSDEFTAPSQSLELQSVRGGLGVSSNIGNVFRLSASAIAPAQWIQARGNIDFMGTNVEVDFSDFTRTGWGLQVGIAVDLIGAYFLVKGEKDRRPVAITAGGQVNTDRLTFPTNKSLWVQKEEGIALEGNTAAGEPFPDDLDLNRWAAALGIGFEYAVLSDASEEQRKIDTQIKLLAELIDCRAEVMEGKHRDTPAALFTEDQPNFPQAVDRLFFDMLTTYDSRVAKAAAHLEDDDSHLEMYLNSRNRILSTLGFMTRTELDSLEDSNRFLSNMNSDAFTKAKEKMIQSLKTNATTFTQAKAALARLIRTVDLSSLATIQNFSTIYEKINPDNSIEMYKAATVFNRFIMDLGAITGGNLPGSAYGITYNDADTISLATTTANTLFPFFGLPTSAQTLREAESLPSEKKDVFIMQQSYLDEEMARFFGITPTQVAKRYYL